MSVIWIINGFNSGQLSALLLVEVSAPVLLPAAALLTPGATTALAAKLEEWGLDADGLNAKIEKVLEDTS